MTNKPAFRFLLVFAAILFFFSCGKDGSKINSPNSLVVSEGFENPIGLYDNEPSFSWKLPVSENIKSQTAYRVVVASDPQLLPKRADLWDSGEVDSDQSVWVKYNGTPLESRQKAYWQVMFRDQAGKKSAWSEVGNFELGLLNNNDWKAKWISLPRVKMDTTKEGYFLYSPQYLIKDFNLEEKIEKARLYITSKGVFEAQINGNKVGDEIMTPGWTPYKKRIETLTYDVKDLLCKGENIIGIVLGEGWYSGRIGYNRKAWGKKPLPQMICQLEITYKNGEEQVVYSDADWKGTRNGPIRFSGIYDGEIYDANMEMPGWSKSEFDAGNWIAVEKEDVGTDINLTPKRHASVTDKIELPTLKITEPEPGRFVFDLGQNMVGIPSIKIPVKKNQKVTIRFAEMLQQDGKMYTANYRSAKSIDYYIPKADGVISWQPKFTFHGNRYVELSGFDEGVAPSKDWVTGIVQYSDFDKRGTFTSSHDKLNKLQSNINWGLRGNFFDIPTDCPQRDERLGWTGDAQVFAPTSIFNCDVHAFWSAWLQSVREEQFDDGGIPFVVPNILGNGKSSGWADAATVIPWEIYFRTGDKEVLEENYGMMKKLVGYYSSEAEDHIANVNTFGDWLQPYPQREKNNKGDTPRDLIGTAYYARSINLTLDAAKVLGYEKDAAELLALRDSVRKAFEDKFLDDEGKLTTFHETQTGYLMALGFDLVSEEMAQKVLPRLITQIEKADNHLRTGFLGTPLLATVLDKYELTDLMYTILFKETYPSWFFSINQGATTMWERWNSYSHKDGFGDVGMNSFNHYAYGAIGQWMYERIAGISPLEPGYKKILIAPVPGGPLEHAKAEFNSIYGKISSGWKKVNNGLELDVTIPPNTTAKVVIPISEGLSLKLNGGAIANSLEVKVVAENSNSIELEIVPGEYSFKTE
jgi:alpha-L-rhamnosidase